ncbi:MAG TPA: UDP-N-acetylmuramate dehydrogenase [Candidatus Dormibacteraeota bacterium]|nr:UDP-N-acetylmuramate dehydrogenase [Candidatus Dormibacteraeota bacterium]
MAQLLSSPETLMSSLEHTADEFVRLLSPASIVRRNEPLAKRTTLRVGGPADIYVEPGSEEDLGQVVRFCCEQKLAFFVLGRGSNLLIKDGGFRGVAISLAQPFFSRIEAEGQSLVCGAGARLKLVAQEAKRKNISGFEFMEGIPGSVGGALRMNAGAMGGATFDIVESVRLMDLSGHIFDKPARELQVEYRSCPALKSHIAMSAVLHGKGGEREVIEARMNECSRKRWDSQPAAPSAGCMFKNPASIPAGKLIQELELKGMRVGGAMVSHEHGNFIINQGGATARDVLELIALIKKRARDERGIELQTEVEIIGE